MNLVRMHAQLTGEAYFARICMQIFVGLAEYACESFDGLVSVMWIMVDNACRIVRCHIAKGVRRDLRIIYANQVLMNTVSSARLRCNWRGVGHFGRRKEKYVCDEIGSVSGL